jgi:hypothetical protein
MSNIETVEKLRKLVFETPALSSRIEAGRDEAGMVAALVAIGAEKGLPITEADVVAWRASEAAKHQLSDEQLADVAGGISLTPGLTPKPIGGLTPPSLGPKPGQINPTPGGGVAYVSYGDSILCGFCGSTSGTNK